MEQQKTIFITGGSTGIGAACVRLFAAKGWNVAFMDINAGAGSALAAELPGVLFVEGSTRSRQDIRRAVDAAVERFGALHSVFANAGIHRKNTLLDISDEDLDLIIGTNIYGTVNTLREAVPHIIAAGGGTVVLNASDQVFVGKTANFAYGLTKGAIGQITRSLAADLAPKGVRVNAICPGTIHTPLVDNIFDRLSERTGRPVAEYLAEEDALYPRGSMGQPDEVAPLVLFLAGDESSFCTGGHYLIDGGLVASR